MKGRAKAFLTRSARATEAAGANLASRLRPGDCVCLTGPLGAGKTVFVRGALRALGVRSRAVSPTFTLAHEARGRNLNVVHLDLYRLGPGGAESRGLIDYLDGRFVVFAEWADRDMSFWPRGAITVRITRRRDGVRRIGVRVPVRRDQ